MSTRIEKILANARITLADKNKERWTDTDLISILDEGHIDFCHQTQSVYDRKLILITPKETYITLPSNCWKLVRVMYKSKWIPLVTFEEMDIYGEDNWMEKTGNPEKVVYNQRNIPEVRLYPIPEIVITSNLATVPDFGVLTDYEDTENETELNDFFGITSNFSNLIGTVDIDIFGVIRNIETSLDSLLLCHYLINPGKLETVKSSLINPEVYDFVLKFYLCGHAFMNDLDASYQDKGLVQLRFYEDYVEKVKKASMGKFIKSEQYTTTYRGVL